MRKIHVRKEAYPLRQVDPSDPFSADFVQPTTHHPGPRVQHFLVVLERANPERLIPWLSELGVSLQVSHADQVVVDIEVFGW